MDKKPDFTKMEQDALSGKITMTPDILHQCLVHCLMAHDEREFADIKKRFPEVYDALGWEEPYVTERRHKTNVLCGGSQRGGAAPRTMILDGDQR